MHECASNCAPSLAIGRCVAPRPHGAAAALHTPRVEGGLSIREGARLKASWRVARSLMRRGPRSQSVSSPRQSCGASAGAVLGVVMRFVAYFRPYCALRYRSVVMTMRMENSRPPLRIT